MTKTVSHVQAKFGGRSVRFELPRQPAAIGALEKEIGSIPAAWGRFGAGDWRIGDVRAILVAAHPAVKKPPQEPGLSHRLAMLEGKTIPPEMRAVPPERIDRVMTGRPFATYARLATLILVAALFGLPETDAVFDEDGALVAAPPPDEAAA